MHCALQINNTNNNTAGKEGSSPGSSPYVREKRENVTLYSGLRPFEEEFTGKKSPVLSGADGVHIQNMESFVRELGIGTAFDPKIFVEELYHGKQVRSQPLGMAPAKPTSPFSQHLSGRTENQVLVGVLADQANIGGFGQAFWSFDLKSPEKYFYYGKMGGGAAAQDKAAIGGGKKAKSGQSGNKVKWGDTDGSGDLIVDTQTNKPFPTGKFNGSDSQYKAEPQLKEPQLKETPNGFHKPQGNDMNNTGLPTVKWISKAKPGAYLEHIAPQLSSFGYYESFSDSLMVKSTIPLPGSALKSGYVNEVMKGLEAKMKGAYAGIGMSGRGLGAVGMRRGFISSVDELRAKNAENLAEVEGKRQEEECNMWWLLWTFLALVVIGGIAAFFWRRYKQKQAAEAEAGAVTPVVVPVVEAGVVQGQVAPDPAAVQEQTAVQGEAVQAA